MFSKVAALQMSPNISWPCNHSGETTSKSCGNHENHMQIEDSCIRVIRHKSCSASKSLV